MVSRPTEEFLEELVCIFPIFQRGAGGKDTQLRAVRGEPKPVEKQAYQVRHFGTRRAAVQVKLIHHEVEHVIAVLL